GALPLAACGGGDDAPAPAPAPAPGPAPAPALGFQAVSKDLADRLVVASGYTATVLYATGDSIDPAVADYRNDGTDGDFARRAGDHHDAIAYFGLNDAGTARDAGGTQRALLAMNHENIAGTVTFMHPAGQTNAASGARPEAEALKEIQAHGVSVVEMAKNSGKFALNKASRFNRRITAATPIELRGPVRGSALVKTKYSPEGTATRGTINNCAGGPTPWGTYLTCEENWAGYFRRATGDDAARSAKENIALLRVGLRPGQAGNNRWTSVVPADAASTEFSRWDASVTAADAAGDFRNAPNTFGFTVEIDPYDPNSTPRKRTAMGRFAKEGATCGLPVAGKPLAFYMGDDSRGEYVYKFVSKALWDTADAARGGVAMGDKYLDEGTLYVARYNADGSGTWLKLDMTNAAITGNAAYAFSDLADVLVNTRLAADAAGATKMDRPEWSAVNPKNGEVYLTMTENPDRGNTGSSSNNNPNPPADAANPRYWLDKKNGTTSQKGNVNGHIVRMRETASDAAATTFSWDIFLFGAQAKADAGLDDANYQKNVNLSGLSEFNDLSKPDGCWFSPVTGILWIETDDNTYTDVTNCMLLAAIPGEYGDGGPVTIVNKADGSPNAAVTTDVSVATRMGRKMTDATFKRFLTAPSGAEVTGLTESPDGRALFINIQHPGENTAAANIGDATKFESHWPGNGAGVAAYGPGGASARPRSSTVMITRNDGGLIGK
ncbi:alkaline phosphatase PhoX, partial [Ramlibacter sp.]|uniref:PhoX family protein n=1 Tax=Ramlibacter sp. TaxID=1917967 RepID=UPI0018434A01